MFSVILPPSGPESVPVLVVSNSIPTMYIYIFILVYFNHWSNDVQSSPAFTNKSWLYNHKIKTASDAEDLKGTAAVVNRARSTFHVRLTYNTYDLWHRIKSTNTVGTCQLGAFRLPYDHGRRSANTVWFTRRASITNEAAAATFIFDDSIYRHTVSSHNG